MDELRGTSVSRRSFVRSGGLAVAGLIESSPWTRLGASPPDARTHRVVQGDTLSEIAEKYGTSVSQLKGMNGLKNDLIRIGQLLTVGRGFRFLKPGLVRVRNLRRSQWRHIIGHHSATRYGNAKIYGKAHRRRGMENGLAYHFLIGNGVDSGDGEIEIGNRWKSQIEGGHVSQRSYNLNSIGVCVIGDFQKTSPTKNQIIAFKELVEYLKNDLLGGRPKFLVHKELKGEHTVCPGKYFPVSDMHRQFG